MSDESVQRDPEGGAEPDGDPPSSGTAASLESSGSSSSIRLLDRRAPGGPASSIEIDFGRLSEDARRLERLFDRPVDATVALLDDVEMDRLHREHSGVPGTTDVLSFLGETEDPVSGDLAVGVEVAAREAAVRNRPLESELMLYIVHGLLHLLGERDDDDASRARMVDAQDRLLRSMDLPTTEGGTADAAGIPGAVS